MFEAKSKLSTADADQLSVTDSSISRGYVKVCEPLSKVVGDVVVGDVRVGDVRVGDVVVGGLVESPSNPVSYTCRPHELPQN